MFWYRKDDHADTTNRAIGLMTLNAQKHEDDWKWITVNNPHTPRFYRKITPVSIDE